MIYKGYWNYAYIDEPIVHTVKASNVEDAWVQLVEWAIAHKAIVDIPTDVHIKRVPNKFLRRLGALLIGVGLVSVVVTAGASDLNTISLNQIIVQSSVSFAVALIGYIMRRVS